MPFYLKQIEVSRKFAQAAPRYGVIMREDSSFKDQDGKIHVAAIVRWFEADHHETRMSAFDTTSGEYLGEVIK